MFAAHFMEMKRENELLRNKLAEATMMQKKLEQDIVALQKVGVRHVINRVAIGGGGGVNMEIWGHLVR